MLCGLLLCIRQLCQGVKRVALQPAIVEVMYSLFGSFGMQQFVIVCERGCFCSLKAIKNRLVGVL